MSKYGEIDLRWDGNRSEVCPRTAEQGFGAACVVQGFGAAWSRGPACGDAFAEPNGGALLRSRIQAHLPGQIPIHGAPLPPCGARRARGCAPDPVREAPVREGAHKAASDIGETGRIASAPANGPAANGSQPHPVAGRLPSHWKKRGLAHTYAVASPKGPLFRTPVRTPREVL